MNRFPLLFYFLLCFSFYSFSQESKPALNEIEQVWQNYNQYQEPSIKTRLFKHSDLLPLIEKHAKSNLLQNEVIGESVEKRSIHHLTIGRGKTKVLLWSQMHGDEATATMALFDLFNFLAADDQFNSLRNRLMSQLELHLVPMLNPDGAQVWTRRNSMNIDLNRDAKNLVTPEGRALMDLAIRLKPAVGFNLHDQSTFYAAGKHTKNPATISFLAPAYNAAKEMNPTRAKAVQLIASINKAIQTKIPAQVAKYNDTHDSTCFGDTFQGMGISTILIESGGYLNDPDKQYIRKINFYGLLNALDALTTQAYLNEEQESYWSLPNNSRNLYDVIIRNLRLPIGKGSEKVDLAINRNQRLDPDFLTMNYHGAIVKTAGLDSAFGYQELDANGLNVLKVKIKKITKAKWENLSTIQEFKLLKKGFLYINWKDQSSPVGPIRNKVLNLTNKTSLANVAVATTSNFILAKGKKPMYAMINGFLITLSAEPKPLTNTIGY